MGLNVTICEPIFSVFEDGVEVQCGMDIQHTSNHFLNAINYSHVLNVKSEISNLGMHILMCQQSTIFTMMSDLDSRRPCLSC